MVFLENLGPWNSPQSNFSRTLYRCPIGVSNRRTEQPAISYPVQAARLLRLGFVHDVERRFRRATEAAESSRAHNLPDLFLAGLRAQAQPHFLRPRAWRAKQ